MNETIKKEETEFAKLLNSLSKRVELMQQLQNGIFLNLLKIERKENEL